MPIPVNAADAVVHFILVFQTKIMLAIFQKCLARMSQLTAHITRTDDLIVWTVAMVK